MSGAQMNIDADEIAKYFEGCKGIDFAKILDDHHKVNNQEKSECDEIGEIELQKTLCFKCKSIDIVEDSSHGTIVCRNCGQIQESNMVDHSSEWRFFEDDDKSGRTGMPINMLLPQSSLGTSISGMGRNRLKTLHAWSAMPYKERSLYNEFKKIKDACSKLKLLQCVENDAKALYKMSSECKHEEGKNAGKPKITRGVNRISISAGCVFFACVRNGVTRTPKEIAIAYEIKDLEMNRGCKNLLKHLKNAKTNIRIGTTKPENFVQRYCDGLKIYNIYTQDAIKIARNIDKLNVASDHTPYSLAAASILLMAQLHELQFITKKKLALEFNISDVTVVKTFREIEKYKHVLIDNDASDKIAIKINDDLVNEDTPQEVIDRMKKFGLISDESIGKQNVKTNKFGAKMVEMTDVSPAHTDKVQIMDGFIAHNTEKAIMDDFAEKRKIIDKIKKNMISMQKMFF